MASAYIRLKVELPDDQAAALVRDRHPAAYANARQIVADVTSQVLDELQGSKLARTYLAEITLAR